MRRRKIEDDKERKYEKGISLYPLKPEDVLSAFMRVNLKKILKKGGKKEQ